MSGTDLSISEQTEKALWANYANIAHFRAKGESWNRIAAKYGVTVHRLKKFVDENEVVKQTIAEYKLADAELYRNSVEDAVKGLVRDENGQVIQVRNPDGNLAFKMLELVQADSPDEEKADEVTSALAHFEVYDPEKAKQLLECIVELQKLIDEANVQIANKIL